MFYTNLYENTGHQYFTKVDNFINHVNRACITIRVWCADESLSHRYDRVMYIYEYINSQ